MGSNMGMKGLPLLAKVQRSNVQTSSGKYKMYFSLYATKPFIIHYSESFTKR